MGEGTGEGFVWPPRDADGEPGDTRNDTPTTTRTAKRIPAEQTETAFEQFERVWLGVRGRSFSRRADVESWHPDADGAACWRCGTGVGPFECDGDGCAWCRSRNFPWDRFVRVGPYEGVLRDAILELKFERWRRTGADIGRLLGVAIGAELGRQGIDPEACAIVPVPTSWRNRFVRGVDHTLVLARAASEASGVRVRRVLRRRHGPSQTEIPVSRRHANVRGRILARDAGAAGRLDGVRVAVVLDDIRTTGATLSVSCGAVRPLLSAGAEGWGEGAERVWAAAAAVTPDAQRRREKGQKTGPR